MAARVLTLDIETSPAEGLFFGSTYKTFIQRVTEPTRMICFAAKWLDSRKVEFFSEWGEETGRTHFGMVSAAHGMLNEADAVVTYNGKAFDSLHLATEFKLAGLNPPSPYTEVDLYRVIKRRFKFQQNRLDFVAQQVGLGGKLQHEGFDLWLKVLAGDPNAQRQMQKYNERDVRLTERLYRDLLPWIPNNLHPNLNLYQVGEGCPRCSAPDGSVQRRGHAATSLGRYPRFQCQSCGGWLKGKKAEQIADLRGIG